MPTVVNRNPNFSPLPKADYSTASFEFGRSFVVNVLGAEPQPRVLVTPVQIGNRNFPKQSSRTPTHPVIDRTTDVPSLHHKHNLKTDSVDTVTTHQRNIRRLLILPPKQWPHKGGGMRHYLNFYLSRSLPPRAMVGDPCKISIPSFRFLAASRSPFANALEDWSEMR